MIDTGGLAVTARTSLMVAAAVVGGIATAATVGAFFGSTWWVFEFFTNFRWHLMWAALIAAVVYGLTQKGITTGVFVVAFALNAWAIHPVFTGSQLTGTGEDGVTIVAANLTGAYDNTEEVLHFLFDSGADLLVLDGFSRSRVTPITVEGSPYQIVAGPENEEATGLVIVGRGSYPVEVLNTANGTESVYVVSVPAGEGTIDIIAVAGGLANSSADTRLLDQRLAAIGDVLATRTVPTAIVGSLGATRFTSRVGSLMADNDLRDAMEGEGYVATWPVSGMPLIGGWIGIPLDVVLVQRSLTPLSMDIGPDIGAEHLPLTFVLGPAAGG